jgi:hypothetical protein
MASKQNLDINVDPTERSLDSVQQKLNKILATIAQINSSMTGVPSQFGGSGAPGTSAQGSAQAAPMAATGMGGVSHGSFDMGMNPSIMSSMMLSAAMRGGMPGNGAGGVIPTANTSAWTVARSEPVNQNILADAARYQNMVGIVPDQYGDGLYQYGPDQARADNMNRLNSFATIHQGAANNNAVAALMNAPDNMALMNPAMYDHLGALQAQGQAQRAAAVSARQGQFLQMGGVAVSGAASLAQQYARTTISGNQDPGAFGQIYGGIAGGLVGGAIAMSVASAAAAGAAAGSVVPGLGTLIGAGIGATIGAATMAVGQAGYIADARTQEALTPYAISSGGSAPGMQTSAYKIAKDYDDTQASKASFGNQWLSRKLGLQTGIDNASEQQVGQIMSSLGGAYQNAGMDPGQGGLQRMSRQILNEAGGAAGVVVASSVAHGLGNINRAGNNAFDLARMVGVPEADTFLRHMGRGAEAATLDRGIGAADRATYASGLAGSDAAGLSADYRATGYSSANWSQRQGNFRAMIGGLNDQISAVDTEMTAISGAGGQGGSEYKAKAALKRELLEKIAGESANNAQFNSSSIQANSGVNLTTIALQGTTAGLYGSAGDIKSAANSSMTQLSAEAAQLRGVTGLSYTDSLARDQRLASISLQQAAIPAQAAGAAARRSMLPLDVAAGQQGVSYQGAGLYGSDSALGDAALTAMNGQQAIIAQANRSLHDPALSLEDRAAAQGRISGANASLLQIRAGSRDSLLNRIEGRAGIANSDASNALNLQLSIGSGSMVRGAGIALIGSLDQESASIAGQLAAGGLTAEQEIRLKGRQSALAGQKQSTFQGIIDQGIARDDMSDYATGHMRTQGQQERLQYLPFSASNPMRLSIQSLSENRAQLGVLSRREADLRASGNLSPEREYDIERSRQSLLTENSRSVGQMSEGMENRLPALSAGAPSFFGRYSSVQLAALNLQMAGSPIRAYGAANGAHMRSQDDYIRSAGGEMHDVSPHSRTASLNSGANMDRLAAALERLVGVLDKGGSSAGGDGSRPGERAGMVSGSLSRQNLNTSGLYGSRN